MRVFSKCLCLCQCICLRICFFCWSGHFSSSLWSNRYLKAFSKCICLCLSVGQFVSPMTHSDHTSQRSQVSRITKYVCLCLFVSLIMSPLHCDQTSQGQKSPWKWTMSCVCFKTKRSLTESPSIKLSWSVAGQIKTLFNWIFLQLAYL